MKFGRIVRNLPNSVDGVRFCDISSYFPDDGHDVRLPFAAASDGCPLTRRARDVIGPLYALQFLIHSTFGSKITHALS